LGGNAGYQERYYLMSTLMISLRIRLHFFYCNRFVNSDGKKAVIVALMRKTTIITYTSFVAGERFDEARYLKAIDIKDVSN